MIVRVIGMKCTKSAKLMELVKTVMKELGINAAIEEISELNKMLKYPIFNSPALMIEEKVVCEGHVPDIDEMKRMVKDAIGK
jgi:small redox-active disulfide protein 2